MNLTDKNPAVFIFLKTAHLFVAVMVLFIFVAILSFFVDLDSLNGFTGRQNKHLTEVSEQKSEQPLG